MEASPKPGAVCSTCGEPMSANGTCLICLLRGGMDETAAAQASADVSPVYGDFEVARREDGSLWELGRGAMGVTYRAVDRVLHRTVALKVIRLGGGAGNHDRGKSEAVRERFLREARAAAALRHANVAGIYQFGASDQADRCFYAMELVEGETLEARVRRDGPLDVNTALEIARQVCAALMAAAGRGLIHRDLKPGNLMLTTGGSGSPVEVEVKVIDFGLAKATAAIGEVDLTHGGFVGTPAFASPEQFARGAVDARSDLYSLGITLWYALAGKVPFTGRALEELRDAPERRALPVEQLTARGVPVCVVGLLHRVLAIDPARRPASAKELLSALDACRQQLLASKAPPSARRWLVTILLAALGLAAAGMIWWQGHAPASLDHRTPAASAIPEKSLAVLPFDNFSADKDSAFFADGVQDEVLTDLAKIADLKVISRSSVMQYRKSDARNLKEIGKTLGVAYVVEGSVQKAGNQIKVTAQLIDARTDTHQWAEEYVRGPADVFAIQSEIAQAIAGQLRAAVSPQEQATIEEVPTRDMAAYELYIRAREKWRNFNDADDPATFYQGILRLLTEATVHDPQFARAFAFMTLIQANVYSELETTPAQASVVRGLSEVVARLRPGSTDAHWAAGVYDNFVLADESRARAEFLAALQFSPHDARLIMQLVDIDWRQGRWEEARARLHEALERDPENTFYVSDYAAFLRGMRRYAEAVSVLDRWMAAHPEAFWARLEKCRILLAWRADPPAARAELALLPPGFDPHGQTTAVRVQCSLYERDFAAAARDLAACPLAIINETPRAFYEADLARCRGDAGTAMAAYANARSWAETRVRERPEDVEALGNLAKLDAFLGHKEAALDEGRRMRLLVKPDDASTAITAAYTWAQVLTFAGERDQAILTLQAICGQPPGPEYGDLRSDPHWDPLRGDPRFEAMVASLAPRP